VERCTRAPDHCDEDRDTSRTARGIRFQRLSYGPLPASPLAEPYPRAKVRSRAWADCRTPVFRATGTSSELGTSTDTTMYLDGYYRLIPIWHSNCSQMAASSRHRLVSRTNLKEG
jgi:hypothetical protein